MVYNYTMHNGNSQDNGYTPYEPGPITSYRLTIHAIREIGKRNLSESDVAKVLASPEQLEIVRHNRWVYQGRIEMNNPPKTYLLRVFVDVDDDPPSVVTVYRTSKISKYWRDV